MSYMRSLRWIEPQTPHPTITTPPQYSVRGVIGMMIYTAQASRLGAVVVVIAVVVVEGLLLLIPRPLQRHPLVLLLLTPYGGVVVIVVIWITRHGPSLAHGQCYHHALHHNPHQRNGLVLRVLVLHLLPLPQGPLSISYQLPGLLALLRSSPRPRR